MYFRGHAVDQKLAKTTPEKTVIIKDHNYFLVNFMPEGYIPEVKVIQEGLYYFTLEAFGAHPLKGTAIHGLFKDECGYLYMFQQGRGVKNEGLIGRANLSIADVMWGRMAENYRTLKLSKTINRKSSCLEGYSLFKKVAN